MKIRGKEYDEAIDEEFADLEDDLDPVAMLPIPSDGRDDDLDLDDDLADPRDRKARRAQRGQDWDGNISEELAKRDREIAELRGQVTAMGTRAAPPQPQMTQEQIDAAIDTHLKPLRAEVSAAAQEVLSLGDGKENPQALREAEARYFRANEKYMRENARIAQIQNAPPPPDPNQQAEVTRWQTLMHKHGDVLGDKNGRKLVDAELLRISTSKPDGWKATDEDIAYAVEKARQETGGGRYRDLPAPRQMRDATTGYPASMGSHRDDRQDDKPLTGMERSLALAWYSEMERSLPRKYQGLNPDQQVRLSQKYDRIMAKRAKA